MNPFRFFCLNIRRMNASTEVATTFSACITTIPVIDSAKLGNVSKSTTSILEVILNIPPDAYNLILLLVLRCVRAVPLIHAYFVGVHNLQARSRSAVRSNELGHALPHEGLFSCFRSDHYDKVLVDFVVCGGDFGVVVGVQDVRNERQEAEAAGQNEQRVVGEDRLKQQTLVWKRQ